MSFRRTLVVEFSSLQKRFPSPLREGGIKGKGLASRLTSPPIPSPQSGESEKNLWIFLFAVAAIPRLLGAFLLPNTFGDAYVYIRDIGTLSTKIKAGTFALTDLYGFWLPLYQFISALVNVFVGNGFYTGKIVSALAGVGVCLLVYAITLRVVQTPNRSASVIPADRAEPAAHHEFCVSDD